MVGARVSLPRPLQWAQPEELSTGLGTQQCQHPELIPSVTAWICSCAFVSPPSSPEHPRSAYLGRIRRKGWATSLECCGHVPQPAWVPLPFCIRLGATREGFCLDSWEGERGCWEFPSSASSLPEQIVGTWAVVGGEVRGVHMTLFPSSGKAQEVAACSVSLEMKPHAFSSGGYRLSP